MSGLLRSAGVDDASAAISVQEMLSGFGGSQMQVARSTVDPGSTSNSAPSGGYDWGDNSGGFPGFDYDVSGLDSSWFE